METFVSTLIRDPPLQKGSVIAIIEEKLKTEIEKPINSKLRTQEKAVLERKVVTHCLGAYSKAMQSNQWKL